MKRSSVLNKLLNTVTITNYTKFVIAISGGKDSKATLIISLDYLLKIIEPSQIVVIFCDTVFEDKKTYEEIEKIKDKLKDLSIEFKRLVSKKYPLGMLQMLEDKNIFPSRNGKFCTDILKMQPSLNYYKQLYKSGFDVIVLVGKRRDESKDRLNTPDNEFKKFRDYNFNIWYPIANWTETDVFSLLNDTWGIPELYYLGRDRVGCDECFQANLKAISLMSDDNINKLEIIEKKVQDKRKEFVTFFYRKNSKFPNGWVGVKDMCNYAKERNNYSANTFHTRALIKLVNKYGNKTIRFKFLKFGTIPPKTHFSSWVNAKATIPQNLLFIIEILTSKFLNKREREDLLKFDFIEENEINCDCESYNLL